MDLAGIAQGDTVAWKGRGPGGPGTGPLAWGYVAEVQPDGRLLVRYGRYQRAHQLDPAQVVRWSPGRAEYDRQFRDAR